MSIYVLFISKNSHLNTKDCKIDGIPNLLNSPLQEQDNFFLIWAVERKVEQYLQALQANELITTLFLVHFTRTNAEHIAAEEELVVSLAIVDKQTKQTSWKVIMVHVESDDQSANEMFQSYDYRIHYAFDLFLYNRSGFSIINILLPMTTSR